VHPAATGQANVRKAERSAWQAAFTAVPILFLFLSPNRRPYIVKITCVYVHMSECVQAVYE